MAEWSLYFQITLSIACDLFYTIIFAYVLISHYEFLFSSIGEYTYTNLCTWIMEVFVCIYNYVDLLLPLL